MSLSRIVLHLFNNLLQNIIAPEPGGFINNLLISLSFRVFIPAVEVAYEQLEQVAERDDAGDAAVLVEHRRRGAGAPRAYGGRGRRP